VESKRVAYGDGLVSRVSLLGFAARLFVVVMALGANHFANFEWRQRAKRLSRPPLLQRISFFSKLLEGETKCLYSK
jgi:hypothetical protein